MTQSHDQNQARPKRHGDSCATAASCKALRAMVRAALDEDRASLAFQPIVVAEDPDRISFFEALVRIVDAAGNPVSAGEFIPACEDYDIVRDIDRRALELCLRELKRAPGLHLAVNMSARSIGDPRWAGTLEQGLIAAPDAGARLIVEITESSALPETRNTMEFLEGLRARSIRVALDDFGTGHTSFRQIKALDFDILKIAGEFASNLHADTGNRVLTRAIVSIARQFGISTVAEAVETRSDAHALAEFGIDGLQGYFFGRPSSTPHWREFQTDMSLAV